MKTTATARDKLSVDTPSLDVTTDLTGRGGPERSSSVSAVAPHDHDLPLERLPVEAGEHPPPPVASVNPADRGSRRLGTQSSGD
jgi:hypothetical protein